MAPEPPLAGRARRAAASFLKFAGIVLVVVAVIGAAGAAFVSSRYFAAAVEAELARSMLDAKRRTLKFDGPLEIFFWPNAGFEVGHVSLSEPDSAQEFASLDAARFSVAVMPLFRASVVVDHCSVEGLKATVVKRRDGTLNIDDLFAAQQPSNARFTVDAAGLEIRHATLTWTDEARDASMAATDLDLASGRLHADTATKTFRADDLSLSGSIGAARVRLGATGVAASPAALAIDRLALDLHYQAAADTTLDTSLKARLAIDPVRSTIALEQLTGGIDVVHPRLAKSLKLPLRGGFKAGPDAAEGDLATGFDDSNAVLKFAVSHYSPLALRFEVDVDRLDVGRYLSAHHAEAGPAETRQSPLDFSALDGVELDGTARIGSLRIAGVETRDIRLEIRGRHGKLDVRGIGAKGK